eukprot:2032508-Rhodomonas_salina.1
MSSNTQPACCMSSNTVLLKQPAALVKVVLCAKVMRERLVGDCGACHPRRPSIYPFTVPNTSGRPLRVEVWGMRGGGVTSVRARAKVSPEGFARKFRAKLSRRLETFALRNHRCGGLWRFHGMRTESLTCPMSPKCLRRVSMGSMSLLTGVEASLQPRLTKRSTAKVYAVQNHLAVRNNLPVLEPTMWAQG